MEISRALAAEANSAVGAKSKFYCTPASKVDELNKALISFDNWPLLRVSKNTENLSSGAISRMTDVASGIAFEFEYNFVFGVAPEVRVDTTNAERFIGFGFVNDQEELVLLLEYTQVGVARIAPDKFPPRLKNVAIIRGACERNEKGEIR